ncbi:hypothetical protein EPO56_01565 [Patescibacteria group bacterium]|nr:MAG: hypothetical protein EPO56_01565 [Patescibacteria group bacterium]
MKRKLGDLKKEEFIRTLDMLYTAAGAVKGRDAMKLFLRDLLTPSERIMLGRRIWIARLLLAGTERRNIMKKLKVGPNTIEKVARWLHDQFPGYEEALKGLEREMDNRALKREVTTDPFSFAAMKRRYPLHFLLFPTPKPKKKYRD